MRAKGESKGLGAFLLFLVLLALPGWVTATEDKVAEYQGQLNVERNLLWGPGRMAAGWDGTLYVVDGYRNHVVKFGPGGAYAGDIQVPKASAVAVAHDGTLYVGSHLDYKVSIIRNSRTTGYLGIGAHEFSSITDIAVDGDTGNVYVADTAENVVKVYNATGRRIGAIKDVHLPMAVKVVGNEIYVVNAPAVEDKATKEKTTSSEIAVFDKAGRRMWYFGEKGPGACQMTRPTDIGVVEGKIYVTDAGKKAILVYDMQGSCQGEIRADDGELDSAVSLAYSPEGTLYVSTNGSQSIQAFSVAGK